MVINIARNPCSEEADLLVENIQPGYGVENDLAR
jgi:hypothetical protein